ncbi:conserved hypothetical protein [Trichinella spiralis]|uniref:hypothetical protein n=1 Tax=Trichinella spiralis TaxID=6334 RepID=UPI0001EFC8DB|nr:conserved hypothetical protein [Trichinella spiralis]
MRSRANSFNKTPFPSRRLTAMSTISRIQYVIYSPKYTTTCNDKYTFEMNSHWMLVLFISSLGIKCSPDCNSNIISMSTNLNTEIRKAFSGWPLVLNCQSNGANQDKESICWWFQQNNHTYLIPSNNATLAIIEKANLTLLTVSPEISGYHFICGYQERALRRFEIKVMLCNDDDPCNGRGNCLTYQNDKIAPVVYCKCKDKYFGTFCTEHIPIESFVKMTIGTTTLLPATSRFIFHSQKMNDQTDARLTQHAQMHTSSSTYNTDSVMLMTTIILITLTMMHHS